MAYRRLVTKCTTENLWLYLLRLLQDRPMYAYELAKTLQRRFDVVPATVTVYVVLYQLQREGLIERDATHQAAGHPARKYYRLTATGAATLQRGVSFLQDLVDQLTARS